MKSGIPALSVLMTVVSLNACSYHVDKAGNPMAKLGANQGFVDLAAPNGLIGSKCLICHDGSGLAVDLREYSAFRSRLADIRWRVSGGNMPKAPQPPLTADEKYFLLAWIDLGAPEHGGDPVQPGPPLDPEPNPFPTTLDFETVKTAVLGRKCKSCHDTPLKVFDYRDYDDVFALRDSIKQQITRTDEKRMPPPDSRPLSPNEFNLLMRWLQAGAPK